MFERRHRLFRKEALERLSSPERLDQLVRIVRPKDWLILLCFALLIGGILLWSIFGRLPTTVTGRGVLIYPRNVVEFQSPAYGRLIEFGLQVGDYVNNGDLVGMTDQEEIRKKLHEDLARLEELRVQDRAKNMMQVQQARLLAQEIEAQKKYLHTQIQNCQKNISDAEAIAPVLERRLKSRRAMLEEGLIPKVSDELLRAEQEFLQNQARISDYRAQLEECESQLRQLETRQTEMERQILEASTSRKNEIQALQANIALYQVQLEKSGQIFMEYTGRILELAVNVGQVINPGQRLGLMEVENPISELQCIAYFAVRDGKRLKNGMKAQITPDTVKRERFGGIRGTVHSISSFPATKRGVTLLLGDEELANHLLGEEPHIEVTVRLERDSSTFSGYRWSSSMGPELRMTPGTTTSNRVTVEERAPITYLLPFLRSLSGIY